MQALLKIQEYLFNTRPFGFKTWGVPFLISAIFCLILAFLLFVGEKLILKKTSPFYKKTIRKAQHLALWYGVVSLIFYFLRIERVPYLSMRIWIWLWFLSFLGLSVFSLYKECKQVPVRKKRTAQVMTNKRYFET